MTRKRTFSRRFRAAGSDVNFDFLRGSKAPSTRKPVPSTLTVPVFGRHTRSRRPGRNYFCFSWRRENSLLGVLASVGFLQSSLSQAWTELLLCSRRRQRRACASLSTVGGAGSRSHRPDRNKLVLADPLIRSSTPWFSGTLCPLKLSAACGRLSRRLRQAPVVGA